MSKKKAILKGLPAVYAANLIDGIIFGAVKMAHMEDPTRTMESISKSAHAIFGLEGVPLRTILGTYYRMERAFLNNGTTDEHQED